LPISRSAGLFGGYGQGDWRLAGRPSLYFRVVNAAILAPKNRTWHAVRPSTQGSTAGAERPGRAGGRSASSQAEAPALRFHANNLPRGRRSYGRGRAGRRGCVLGLLCGTWAKTMVVMVCGARQVASLGWEEEDHGQASHASICTYFLTSALR
jgi:hypothetical protein